MKATDYLAIYAAVLSTMVFVWNVIQSRPRIRVDVVFGFNDKEEVTEYGVYICVRNLSSHDVNLANIGFLYPYRKATLSERLNFIWKHRRSAKHVGWVNSSLSNFSIETGCPVCVNARMSHRVFIPEKTIELMLKSAIHRQLIASVQDQLWNNEYSSPFLFLERKKADA